MPAHILVVDDEALIRRGLVFSLEQSGYRVSAAADAEAALEIARRDPPGLVLMDIGLPGMDGLDALRALRSIVDVPVIMVTARRRELDQALGLELGADDYVTKPFDTNVLLARVKAVLRRAGQSTGRPPAEAQPVAVGDLLVDPVTYTVTLDGRRVDLAPREFDLLHSLARSAGRVCAVDDLIAQVWGAEYQGEAQVVYVHVRWLREKLEVDPSSPKRILTVRGRGYLLAAGDDGVAGEGGDDKVLAADEAEAVAPSRGSTPRGSARAVSDQDEG